MPRCLSFMTNLTEHKVRSLSVGFAKRLLWHILPLALMLLLVGWLTLKADGMIQRSKQLPLPQHAARTPR